MHAGCLIASKKATATKMVFTKMATIERAWNFGERQRGRQFLDMITLERDLKELFFICSPISSKNEIICAGFWFHNYLRHLLPAALRASSQLATAVIIIPFF